ncbi:MAG: helix-turn-helix domain-containing protein [Pseudonocardiales bacterium]
MDHSRLVAALLASPQGCAALAAGHTGMVVRLIRQALGWTQEDLAVRSGYSQSTISRIECGKTRSARDIDVLADLAQLLGVPPAVFGLAPDQRCTLDPVNRRDVLGGAVALAVSALLPRGVATAGRIDMAQVEQCWTALNRLFELDAHHGGGPVYELAAGMAQRLQDALSRGSYPPSVGEELHSVTAATMEHAAWLAYDAGWQQRARQGWLETCHHADLADAPGNKVSALATMALQAGKQPGNGPEVVALAQAARTAGKDQATPTLLSLLAAREAVGHALSGDRAAAVSSVAEARRWLDHGRGGDEPFWLDFWGPADLACHETRVGLITRDGRSAETAARAALAGVDAEAFPRNHTLYTVGLGSVLTRLGQFDEAIAVLGDAVQRVDGVRGSGRTIVTLHNAVDLLGQQKYPPARTFAAAACCLLPVPA